MLAWISFFAMMCGAIASVLLSKKFGLGPIGQGIIGIALAGGGVCLPSYIKVMVDNHALRKSLRKH